MIDRILELGFGKAIEEIIELLGSRQNGLICNENTGVRPSKFSRQNLILSATLNEKVNHLANISLDNPIMIGLDDKNISSELPSPSVRHFGTAGSDGNNEAKFLDKMPSCSSEDLEFSESWMF